MAARVAVVGDVSATPGAVLHEKTAVGSGNSAAAGAWTAGAVEYTSYAHLTSAGAEVIWEAECEFSFTGANTSGSAVNETETVTLTATAKLLNPGQDSVLVDGDTEASSPYGNTLKATAAGPLVTGP